MPTRWWRATTGSSAERRKVARGPVKRSSVPRRPRSRAAIPPTPARRLDVLEDLFHRSASGLAALARAVDGARGLGWVPASLVAGGENRGEVPSPRTVARALPAVVGCPAEPRRTFGRSVRQRGRPRSPRRGGPGKHASASAVTAPHRRATLVGGCPSAAPDGGSETEATSGPEPPPASTSSRTYDRPGAAAEPAVATGGGGEFLTLRRPPCWGGRISKTHHLNFSATPFSLGRANRYALAIRPAAAG